MCVLIWNTFCTDFVQLYWSGFRFGSLSFGTIMKTYSIVGIVFTLQVCNLKNKYMRKSFTKALLWRGILFMKDFKFLNGMSKNFTATCNEGQIISIQSIPMLISAPLLPLIFRQVSIRVKIIDTTENIATRPRLMEKIKVTSALNQHFEKAWRI